MGSNDTIGELCSLCFHEIQNNVSDKNVNGSDSKQNQLLQLKSYIYHQNVKEYISSGVSATGMESHSVPKLTFTLSVGQQNQSIKNLNPFFCDVCSEQLEKLDKLQKELEAVKRAIEIQVKNIKNCRSSKPCEDEKQSVMLLDMLVPKLQMTMAGSILGKENIQQSLIFLSNICSGILPSNSSVALVEDGPLSSAVEKEGTANSPKEAHFSDALMDNISQDFKGDSDPDSIVMKVEVEDVKVMNHAHHQHEQDHEMDYEGQPFYSSLITGTDEDDHFGMEPISSHVDQDPLSIVHTEQDPLIFGADTDTIGDNGLSSVRKRRKLQTKTCTICAKLINGNTNLISHMRTHAGEKPFKCDLCGKGFSQQTHLDRHHSVHTGEKPYSCDICQQKFSRQDSLKRHENRAHRNKT